jgi:hypothetical protein
MVYLYGEMPTNERSEHVTDNSFTETAFANAGVPVVGTMTDAVGDEIRFGAANGAVFIGCDSPAIIDDDAMSDEFLRLYALAREQAKASAG